MPLSWVKESFGSVKKEVLRQVKRQEHEDLFKAVMAGCALVAYADGHFSQSEKARMIRLIRETENLHVFDTMDAVEEFERISELYYFDYVDGEAHAMRKLTRMRDKAQDAEIIARACAVIATVDGVFSEDEKATLRRICHLMNYDPQKLVA